MSNLKKSARRKYRKIPKFLRIIIRWVVLIDLALLFDFFLLYVLASLTALNLINWNTVISFLVIEVLAAVIAKLFRVGGPSDTEEKNDKITLAKSRAQFSHLLVISLYKEGHNDDYPDSLYRIANTRTKLCYWVPSYLEPLIEEETILNEITFKNEMKRNEYLKENKIRDMKKFPTADELGLPIDEASQQKESMKLHWQF